MTKLPTIDGKRLIRALKKAGWVEKRSKGSHVKLIKEGVKHFLIVPIHGKSSIPKGTLFNIIKDSGLTVEEFLRLLK